jgi:hypothetical protein
MMVQELTISLRQVAIRLGQLKSKKEKPDVDRLLTLLISGKLHAGFVFPSPVNRWIDIPQKYWAGIGTDRLLALNYVEGSTKKIGAFKVKLGDFAAQYVQSLAGSYSSPNGDKDGVVKALLEEIQQALPLMARSFEVRVREEVWAAYLSNHDLLDPYERKKRTAGANQKEGWREMSEIIGAYILDHMRRKPNVKIKYSNAADEIHKCALAEGVNDPPGTSMIQDLLSKIDHRAKATKKAD